MTCPKCGSDNVMIQALNETQLKRKHHSIWWWIFIGWWWVPLMWIVFWWFKLIIKVFRIEHKPNKIVNQTVKKGVCQSCGNIIDIR